MGGGKTGQKVPCDMIPSYGPLDINWLEIASERANAPAGREAQGQSSGEVSGRWR